MEGILNEVKFTTSIADDYKIKSSIISIPAKEEPESNKFTIKSTLETILIGKDKIYTAPEINKIASELDINPWKEENHIDYTSNLKEVIVSGISFYTKDEVDNLIRDISILPPDKDEWYEG